MQKRRLFVLHDKLLFKVYLIGVDVDFEVNGDEIENFLKILPLRKTNVSNFQTKSHQVQVSKKPWKNCKSVEYYCDDKQLNTYPHEIWLNVEPRENDREIDRRQETAAENLQSGVLNILFNKDTQENDGLPEYQDRWVEKQGDNMRIQSVEVGNSSDKGPFPMHRVNADLNEYDNLKSELHKREIKRKNLQTKRNDARSKCPLSKKSCDIEVTADDEGSIQVPLIKRVRQRIYSDPENLATKGNGFRSKHSTSRSCNIETATDDEGSIDVPLIKRVRRRLNSDLEDKVIQREAQEGPALLLTHGVSKKDQKKKKNKCSEYEKNEIIKKESSSHSDEDETVLSDGSDSDEQKKRGDAGKCPETKCKEVVGDEHQTQIVSDAVSPSDEQRQTRAVYDTISLSKQHQTRAVSDTVFPGNEQRQIRTVSNSLFPEPEFKIPSVNYARKRPYTLCATPLAGASRTSQPNQRSVPKRLFDSPAAHFNAKCNKSDIGKHTPSKSLRIEHGTPVSRYFASRNAYRVADLSTSELYCTPKSASKMRHKSAKDLVQRYVSTPKKLPDRSELSHLEELLSTPQFQSSARLARSTEEVVKMLRNSKEKKATVERNYLREVDQLRDEVAKSKNDIQKLKNMIIRTQPMIDCSKKGLQNGQKTGAGEAEAEDREMEMNLADNTSEIDDTNKTDTVRLSPCDRQLPRKLAQVLTPAEHQVVSAKETDRHEFTTPYEAHTDLKTYLSRTAFAQVENKGSVAILTPLNKFAPKVIASAKTLDKVQRNMHWRDSDAFERSTNKEPSCYTRDRFVIREEETEEQMKLARFAQCSTWPDEPLSNNAHSMPKRRPKSILARALQLLNFQK